ncbi:two-component sensor histidine kinase [Bacillus sp. JCM 19046]|nr:two-component sensor histidine kinase [Bacillus sp. JCM 19045]GAF16165.1 two-component sensor histidine kinase [Bacillus sp. JCM 19046]
MRQISLFHKMVISIILLLVPVALLYTYSNYVSEQVVRDEIDTRNLNRLEVSMNRLEADLWQVSQFLVALSIDPDTSRLRNIDFLSPYESIELQGNVQQKMLLYQQLSTVLVDVTMFLPDGDRRLSTMVSSPDRPDTLSSSWTYIKSENGNDSDRPYFVQHVQFPIHAETSENAVIIEARLYTEAIQEHLNDLESSEGGYAILYNSSFEPIQPTGMSVDPFLEDGFSLNSDEEYRGTYRLEIDQKDYTVTYIESPSLGWTLVDFVPLEEVLSPLSTTRTWFYITGIVLLCLGVAAAWLLYTQIHRPIDRIKDAILQFKKGDYGTRMSVPEQKEFAIAMSGFNEMADQIQTLIEEVYEEKIRSQQASLKLLQAQIDPHFLYNCLFYIKNMAKVKNTDAVEAMSLHLGDYFRYRTKVEHEETTIEEEIQLVNNFLAIHALRKRHLRYSIDVPEDLLTRKIPRLLLQPIVENAIVHAIDHVDGVGKITITGEMVGNYCKLTVENNGERLSGQQLEEMRENLDSEEVLSESYGMRNVHQRLRKRFSGKSGLLISHSDLGGLRADIIWEFNETERR